MTRGTTPTIIVTLPDSVRLQTAARLYATIRQGGITIRKADEAITLAPGCE